MKHNAPKKPALGLGPKTCSRCGRHGAHIGKYGLDFCRQCFRDIAKNLGFRKYS